MCLHSIDSAVAATHIDFSIRGFVYPGKIPIANGTKYICLFSTKLYMTKVVITAFYRLTTRLESKNWEILVLMSPVDFKVTIQIAPCVLKTVRQEGKLR